MDKPRRKLRLSGISTTSHSRCSTILPYLIPHCTTQTFLINSTYVVESLVASTYSVRVHAQHTKRMPRIRKALKKKPREIRVSSTNIFKRVMKQRGGSSLLKFHAGAVRTLAASSGSGKPDRNLRSLSQTHGLSV